MKCTPAQAGKVLRKLEEQLKDLQKKERKSYEFCVSPEEDMEALRPEYDFGQCQEEMDSLREKIRIVKHAVNVFNTTHELPGFDGVTVDQALIMLPQLKEDKDRLQNMAAQLPRNRITYRSSTLIEYKIANYDIEKANECYQEVTDRISSLQLALDTVNLTEIMDLDFEF
ncbi:MAG: hypothetical protein IKE40_02945 [Firmicutes bacterium]|nr:hypothetical protein [Bacillota bacterium]